MSRQLTEDEKRFSIKNVERRKSEVEKQRIQIALASLRMQELELEFQKKKLIAQYLPYWYEDEKKVRSEEFKAARQDLNINEVAISNTEQQIKNGV